MIGVAVERGNQVLLAPGIHVYNDTTFSFTRFESIQNEHLHHGPLHVVRVKRGEYAKVLAEGMGGGLEPRLLREGCHVMESNLFSVEGRCKVSDSQISHGTLNILQVPKGQVAKVFQDNVPHLLGSGTHYVESSNFQFVGNASLSEPVISHGTITVVRVSKGEVGLAWQDNQAHFLLEPGFYNFDSPNFRFVKHCQTTEKIIALGTKKLVTVFSGEVGLTYDHGKLKVLPPGVHNIDHAAHLVDGFLSTQQMSVRLVSMPFDATTGKPKASASAKKDDLLVCETKDLVKVGVRADVFYAIKNAEIAIESIAKDEIQGLVLETAIATLTNIIRSTTLNDIAQSKHPAALSENAHLEEIKSSQALGDSASAPRFFDKAHEEFLSKLHDDFLKRYGIEITNIRIESFKIMDDELAGNISKQALTTAQTESQLANLAGQTEIATKEQERQAAIRQISAEGEAAAMHTQAQAEKARTITAAEAKAQAEQLATEKAAQAEAAAIVARAKAEAEAIRVRAEAEAAAIELKATAEAKRAKQLAETPLGSQLALLELYTEMGAKSNEGVEKVVYCDLKSNNAGVLGMPSLEALSRDLQGLQSIGVSVAPKSS